MATLDQTSERIGLLADWLAKRLTPEQRQWLDEQTDRVRRADNSATLATAIGLAPRRLGKADLKLSSTEASEAALARPGFDPSQWSVDQAARVLFVLASFDGNEARFTERAEALFRTGDIGEHVALLRGLPLYPAPERLVARAAEGVRSAMQPVFEAVAHRNPFPKENFSEAQWNQMVVKTLFIGSRLAPIQGLDERRNADLARTLFDYAHERWAAGRTVSPELWRCVGPFAEERDIADLTKVLREGSDVEAAAAALALNDCALPSALGALRSAPALWTGIKDAHITWDEIS
jgi:hypothetical protein